MQTFWVYQPFTYIDVHIYRYFIIQDKKGKENAYCPDHC